jgi:dinuclear metal center YbgI/SA1388 family protein
LKCSELIQLFNQQADESYACSWDNVGLLAGSRTKEIQKVYIALDATDAAIEEAIAQHADLLLTHHPLIFQGIKRITDDDLIGRRMIRMIRADLSYYAMHTNFDVMGMAQLAAEKMRLRGTVPLEVTCMEDGAAQGIGRVGSLEREMRLCECCELVKAAFGRTHVKVFADLQKQVQRVAICPGAGKSDVQLALAAGADVYITGDIDHHTGIDAAASGMAVIDAGHYGIEHIFVPYMAQYLNTRAPQLEVAVQGQAEPFQIV